MGTNCSKVKLNNITLPSKMLDPNSVLITSRNENKPHKPNSRQSSRPEDRLTEITRISESHFNPKHKHSNADNSNEDPRLGSMVSRYGDTYTNFPSTHEYANMKHGFQYKKGPLIGKGPYGEVFECLNLNTGELLAVKSFNLYGEDQKLSSYIDTLRREVNNLQKFNHPNIVRYYSIKINKEGHQALVDIVLEYVSGGCVRKLLDKFNKLEEKIISTYTRQVLEGLAYLHEQGIAHRNIKGSNILIDTSGIIKLTDFGCSARPDRFSEENPQENGRSPTLPKGPTYWSAPEVVQKKGQGIAADIWSVGCVVIEMLTGCAPWAETAATQDELHRQIVSEGVPTFPEKLSDNCRDFLQKTFRLRAEDRPGAADLLEHPFVKDDCADGSYMEPESLHTLPTYQSQQNRTYLNRGQSDSQLGRFKTNNFVTNEFTVEDDDDFNHMNQKQIIRQPQEENPKPHARPHAYSTGHQNGTNGKSISTTGVPFDKDLMGRAKKRNLARVLENNDEEETSPNMKGKQHNFSQGAPSTGNKGLMFPHAVQSNNEAEAKEARRRQIEEEMNRDLLRIDTDQLNESSMQDMSGQDQDEEDEEEDEEHTERKEVRPPSKERDQVSFNRRRHPNVNIKKNSLFEAQNPNELHNFLQGRANIEAMESPSKPKASRGQSEAGWTPGRNENNTSELEGYEKMKVCSEIKPPRHLTAPFAEVEPARSHDDLPKTPEKEERKDYIDELGQKEKLRKMYEEQMEMSLAMLNSDKLRAEAQSETSDVYEMKADKGLEKSEKFKQPNYEEEESSRVVKGSAEQMKETWKSEDIVQITTKKFEEDLLVSLKVTWEEPKSEEGEEIRASMVKSEMHSPLEKKRRDEVNNNKQSGNEGYVDADGFGEVIRGNDNEEVKEGAEDMGVINEAEEIKEDSHEEDRKEGRPGSNQFL